MKFKVSSGELLNRLQAQNRTIDSKSPIPILENFLFELNDGKLTITASDSETTIVSELEVSDSDGNGRIAIAGTRLTDYLKRLPEQPVTFSINDLEVEISTMSGKNTQMGFNADEYPVNPRLEPDANNFSLDAEILLAGIGKTAFAAGNDDLRPIMNGIYFDIEDNMLTFVATDSHKLAQFNRSELSIGFTNSFVLGKKPANIIKNIFAKNDGPISITFDSKYIVFTSTTFTLYCRRIQGTYPAYKSVIPNSNPFCVTVNRNDLVNAIGRAALFTDGTGLIKFDIQPNIIHIVAQDLNFQCGSEETIACQYDSTPMSIGFKATILNDLLSNFDSTDIQIKLSDPTRAGIFTPATQKENENVLMLVMPMKI
ncbi:MAG: DNA polymerase III subunit beta [Bacteroidales bacterium]|nr:DNA polymerase III subunit beta [Bacteroidales bacterium]